MSDFQLQYLDTPIDGPCKLCREVGLEKAAKTRFHFGTNLTPTPVCAMCFISQILYNIIPEDNHSFRKFMFNNFMIEVIEYYESLGLITTNKNQGEQNEFNTN